MENQYRGSKRIYLAIPYNDPSSEIRNERFEIANKVTAGLMNLGYNVFSPISHSHPIAVQCNLPRGYEFWKEWNKTFIEWCDELYVVCIDGWRESRGVQDEISIATEMGKKVVLIGYDELEK